MDSHNALDAAQALDRSLTLDAVRGLEGTIWRISAAPRRKAAKKG